MQLRDDRAMFTRAKARVVLVGLGTPERAKWFCEDRRIPFVCTSDPDVSAHRTYGLRRGTLRQVLGPQVYFRWAKASLLSDVELPSRKWGEDVMQMPGTFVIDKEGIVRYTHRNRDVSDNPPNEEILSVLRKLKGTIP